MNKEFEEHIEKARERIKKGAPLKKLLEEYSSRFELKDAFYILTQAQIREMKNKSSF